MKSISVNKGKKIASIVGICLAAALIIIAFCGRYFQSSFKQFANFFVGAFGMSFYGLMTAVIVVCSFTLAGKTVRIPAKYVIHFVLMFFALVIIVHMLSIAWLNEYDYLGSFKAYVNEIYNYYDNLPTFGGVVFGSISYALVKAITIYGASILMFLLLTWTVLYIGNFFYGYFTGKIALTQKTQVDVTAPANTELEPSPETQRGIDPAELARQNALNVLFNHDTTTYPEQVVTTEPAPVQHFDVAPQSELDRNNMPNDPQSAADFLFRQPSADVQPAPKGNDFFANAPANDVKPQPTHEDFVVRGYYNPTPSAPIAEVDDLDDDISAGWKIPVADKPAVVEPAPVFVEPQPQPATPVVPAQPTPVQIDVVDVAISDDKVDQPFVAPTPVVSEPIVSVGFDDVDDAPVVEPVKPTSFVDNDPAIIKNVGSKNGRELVAVTTETKVDGGYQMGFDIVDKAEFEDEQSKIHRYAEYVAPYTELLNDVTVSRNIDPDFGKKEAQVIIDKMMAHKLELEFVKVIVGPSVSRFMFRLLSQKRSIDDIKAYANDIKACLESKSDVLIQTPVPGTSYIGIEVENKEKTPVLLRSVLESPEYQQAKGALVFAIGKEISGEIVYADLAKTPHMLVAGTTGSGKSVVLNSMIVSLMYRYSPEYVRFIMVDPKMVELSRYNHIPHMLIKEAIIDHRDALAAMDYLISEMNNRYDMLRRRGVTKIEEYNAKINPKFEQKMPYLVFVVDELADLVNNNKQAFHSKILNISGKARAAGIHMVIATQSPRVEVIPGTVKNNLPYRIALKVPSFTDSKTVLDVGGAEKLLGYGDMLIQRPDSSDLQRVQGAYIGNDEVSDLVSFVCAKNECFFDENVAKAIMVTQQPEEPEVVVDKTKAKDSQLDPFCKRALRFWLEKNSGKASIASIQRNLQIGFNRAGRIMDTLQTLGYVETPSDSDTGSKQLKVLVTLEELDEIFPDMPD